jgi:hypothetical protein
VAVAVERLAELPLALETVLARNTDSDAAAARAYFQSLWARSHQGELYDLADTNIAAFAASLAAAFNDAS